MNKYFELANIDMKFESAKVISHVLKDTSIYADKHEFVSIMGPSGCGKSTLLKIAGGIVAPTAGQINYNGNTYLNGVPKNLLREFGFVFQQDNLFPWRTCEKNLRLPLEVMKLKGAQWDKRVNEMLELVGLENYRTLYPHEMSGGMRQRAGIARALVHDPEILLMDQPFGALDAITRKMLSFDLQKIWKETRKTILFVTNSVEEAMLLSNRIYVLSSAPSSVYKEFKIDIPYERRTADMLEDPENFKLFEEIDAATRFESKGDAE